MEKKKPDINDLFKPGGWERIQKKWSKPLTKKDLKRLEKLSKDIKKIHQEHEAFMREQARLWHENKYKVIF